MKDLKRNYGIPQEILYTVCDAAWNLCSQNLQKFNALKAFYTEAFIADAQQAVQDAKDLPNSHVTSAFCKKARIDLMASTRQVMLNWQVLKGYITKAYDPKVAKSMLDAAGAAFYLKASVDNWSAVRSLIEAANNFIGNNLNQLTADNNMPVDFQSTFKAAGDHCIELSTSFSNATREKQNTTSIKVEANNAIYGRLVEMLKDGQLVFQDVAAMKRQFTFSHLLSIYRKHGSASLKGYIVNNLKMPVAGAVIVSQDGKYTAATDSKGYYRITRIAADTYTFMITCSGYEPLVQTITFATGTASKGDFEMTNVLLKVA